MARETAARATQVPATDQAGRDLTRSNVEEVVAGIGPRLAALRAGLGLSLQQMSAVSEVSAASIHKIERGDMVPTITTLLKLASVFKRPISYLIGEEPEDPQDVWHVANGLGEPVDRGGVDVVLISGPAVRFRTRGTSIKLPAGSVLEDAPARGGEALVHVASGTVQAKIGAREFSLKRGDTLHFVTDHAASWTNSGRSAAELLHVSVAN